MQTPQAASSVYVRPNKAQTPMTFMMSALYFQRATKAALATMTGNHSKVPAKGAASVAVGQKVCQAKNTARLRMTPTTAAVMAVSGAVNLSSPRVASTLGLPARINRKDGRKVKKVATPAPAIPAAVGV